MLGGDDRVGEREGRGYCINSAAVERIVGGEGKVAEGGLEAGEVEPGAEAVQRDVVVGDDQVIQKYIAPGGIQPTAVEAADILKQPEVL